MILRAMLFLVAFSLEVRVRAETVQLPLATHVTEEPAGCLATADACAFRTRRDETFTVDVKGATLTLDRDTTVIRVENKLSLVAGQLWVRAAQGAITVRSEFGDAKIENAEAWVSRTAHRMTVTSIAGVVEVWPRGATEALTVPISFENWVGRVTTAGQAATGVARSLVIAPHLERWARLFRGSRADFESQALAYRETWRLATEQAAEFNRGLFERKVASLRDKHARELQARQKVESRDRELRALFRRKVLEDL